LKDGEKKSYISAKKEEWMKWKQEGNMNYLKYLDQNSSCTLEYESNVNELEDGEVNSKRKSIAKDIRLLAEENKLLDVIYETYTIKATESDIKFTIRML
jgi:hypothetical protein